MDVIGLLERSSVTLEPKHQAKCVVPLRTSLTQDLENYIGVGGN